MNKIKKYDASMLQYIKEHFQKGRSKKEEFLKLFETILKEKDLLIEDNKILFNNHQMFLEKKYDDINDKNTTSIVVDKNKNSIFYFVDFSDGSSSSWVFWTELDDYHTKFYNTILYDEQEKIVKDFYIKLREVLE